jgi:hypothetical protein
MTRAALAVIVATLAAVAVPASARVDTAFPRVRMGSSALVTSGGGTVAGDVYATRSAVIAWNRKWNTLTLYLLWRRGVTCKTLLKNVDQPGHLVQVHVASAPRVHVGSPMAGTQVAFVTVYRKSSSLGEHVAGLKHGAKLTLQSVDTYPAGVWTGWLKVPTRAYGDGKVYGYNGTFAAKFCRLSS